MQQVFRVYLKVDCLRPMCLEELLMPKADEPKALPMGTIRSESKVVDLWI